MPPRPRGTCDWGGCDDTVTPGSKYCPRHTIEAARNAPRTDPDLFSQTTNKDAAARAAAFTARASLPEEFAGPVLGKAPTSRRAAEGAREGYASRKALIHEHIKSQGAAGATRPEIADALGIGVNSVNSACNTLYRQGYIGSNPEHERPDPRTGVACAVLVDEAHVERWKNTQRRYRSPLAVGRPRALDGDTCDLVHPTVGTSLTETQAMRLRDGAGGAP